uniref:Uncharacterized protein n=1 Tax=Solanum lycopersicum TaxID=4081 RepID=A0A3Q7GFS5_SOLLC
MPSQMLNPSYYSTRTTKPMPLLSLTCTVSARRGFFPSLSRTTLLPNSSTVQLPPSSSPNSPLRTTISTLADASGPDSTISPVLSSTKTNSIALPPSPLISFPGFWRTMMSQVRDSR